MGFGSAQIAQASMISQGVGAVTSAAGSYFAADAQNMQLQSQASSLRFRSDIAAINARIAEMGAQNEMIRGQKEVARLTLQAGQLEGKQVVAQSANGIDLGTGSAAEVRVSSKILAEIDKNTIELNAVRSAWGYRIHGSNYKTDAAIGRVSAANMLASQGSPLAAAGSSLLTGASAVMDSWYKYKKAAG